MSRLLTFIALFSLVECSAAQIKKDMKKLAAEFPAVVHSVMKKHCLSCHSAAERAGDLDLSRFSDFSQVRKDPKTWVKVAEQLTTNEMPPKDEPQLSLKVKAKLLNWVQHYLDAEALANAGDPGDVGIRRLNNAEYTYAIQDLTGLKLNPTATFPVDSAAGEGFTNAVGALSLSPALLTKYMTAAKEVSSHAVLLPNGIRFSPHSTRSDWTKELLESIRAIHNKHVKTVPLGLGTSVGVQNLHGNCQMGQLGQVDPTPYLKLISERYTELEKGQLTTSALAKSNDLNPIYLEEIWQAVSSQKTSFMVQALSKDLRSQKRSPESLALSIRKWQRGLWTFNPVGLKGRKGSRTRWMEPVDPTTQSHEFRIKLSPGKAKHVVISLIAADWLEDGNEGKVVWQRPRLTTMDKPDILLKDIKQLSGIDMKTFGRRIDGTQGEDESLYAKAPATLRVEIPAAVANGREFVVTAKLDSRSMSRSNLLESAQVEVVVGEHKGAELDPPEVNVHLSTVKALYPDTRTVTINRPILVAAEGARAEEVKRAFSDHRKLFPPSFCYPQIVPADEVLTLVLYHREDEPLRRLLLSEQERRELDRLWSELLFVSREPVRLKEVVDSLVETLIGHPQEGGVDGLVAPSRSGLSRFQKQEKDSIGPQLDDLMRFASRAYRRPLVSRELQELRSLYGKLSNEGLDHDRAFRLTLTRVLMATPFLHRVEKPRFNVKSSPVSNYELATRLSFFLWSSIPDQELRISASEDRLGKPAVLKAQTLRMMRDPRIRRLAVEFAGQWLDVYDFATVEKSRKVFPQFAERRNDMHEEVVRFITHAFQEDATVQSLLTADHTFVNKQLAKLYGLKPFASEGWVRVDGMRSIGRGGILGMAAPLAKHSNSERSSPILRGNWVVESLLGERLPRPPKDVPELSQVAAENISIRQMVERHSKDPACSKCHQRIDPVGFALEQFDGIGRRRAKDRSGNAIDSKTKLDDGTTIDGINGLRNHLVTTQYHKFVRQFSRKLLGYALGRQTELSDRPLLRELEQKLVKPDARLSEAILTVINSRQFLEVRGIDP